MTENTTRNLFDSISRWGSFITPLGMIILVSFQSQFVSRAEFNAVTDKFGTRVEAMEKILVQMAEANKVNDRQDQVISDHERRLRDLEHSHQ